GNVGRNVRHTKTDRLKRRLRLDMGDVRGETPLHQVLQRHALRLGEALQPGKLLIRDRHTEFFHPVLPLPFWWFIELSGYPLPSSARAEDDLGSMGTAWKV